MSISAVASARMHQRLVTPVEGMTCASCVGGAERTRRTARGVLDGLLKLAIGRAPIRYVGGGATLGAVPAALGEIGHPKEPVVDAAGAIMARWRAPSRGIRPACWTRPSVTASAFGKMTDCSNRFAIWASSWSAQIVSPHSVEKKGAAPAEIEARLSGLLVALRFPIC